MSIYALSIEMELRSKIVIFLGALAGWSTVFFNRQPFLNVNKDSDPENLLIRVWLPILSLAIIVTAGLFLWAIYL